MIDTDKAYKIEGYEGIAWHVLGHETVKDEDYEWTGIEHENTNRVRAVMIGDDREFTFDVSDLTALNDEDYCSGCGQIGCGWGH